MHTRLPFAGIIASAVVMTLVGGRTASAATQPADVIYGSNPAAGSTFVSNGTRFYYESYGDGAPLLLSWER